ncbi:MAG: spore cortex biosynthesis protein YabQ [Thermoanaerobacteraceae bacterium]|nr:spore cortex biosynthesis protein YabQ [Thermoanaerobacteraceae bacterium]
MIPVVQQFYYFFWTAVIGIAIAFCFDFYRALRWLLKPSRIVTHLCDFFVWIIVTVIAYYGLLAVNWGEVRFYVLLGMGVGAYCYYRFFSRYILRKWHQLFRLTGKVFRVTKRILMVPVRLAKKLLSYPLGLITLVLYKFNGLFGGVTRLLKRKVRGLKHRLREFIRRSPKS